MRATLLVLAACGSQANPSSTPTKLPPEPDAAVLIETQTSDGRPIEYWDAPLWCFTNEATPGPTQGMCEREQFACQRAHDYIVENMKGTQTYTPCATLTEAACFRFQNTNTGHQLEQCAPLVTLCDEMRGSYAKGGEVTITDERCFVVRARHSTL